MCVCVCVCVCVFREHFFVEAYLIKYYRHPFSTYFDPFKSLYVRYNIRLDLLNHFYY